MAKKNDKYFDLFIQMGEYCCEAAEKLYEVLHNYDSRRVRQIMEEMHEIETSGDLIRHQITSSLAKEFITIIEREDIMSISGHVDTVLDRIEDVVMRLYMFDIQKIHEDAKRMADVLPRGTKAMTEALKEMHFFKKSKTFTEKIIAINDLEEEGDALYITAVRNLWTDPYISADERYAWTKIFEAIEKISDACEDVADIVENVVLKNS